MNHTMYWVVMVAAVTCVSTVAAADVPHGLLVDFRDTPSGASTSPSFTWIVPGDPLFVDRSPGSAPVTQAAYQLTVSTLAQPSVVWDSGKVSSNKSVAVPYAGPELATGMSYSWTVTVWPSNAAGPSTSQPATFVTSLGVSGWAPSATWVGLPSKSASVFAYFRTVITPPPATSMLRATAFITADTANMKMLGSYKLSIGGALVAMGPGRGEAPLTGGDARFRLSPYDSVDVTEQLAAAASKPVVIAVQGMNLNKAVAVLMQLNIEHTDGTVQTVTTSNTTGVWRVLPADDIRNPVKGVQSSAGNAGMEWIDARKEPVGWMDTPTFNDSDWATPVTVRAINTDPSTTHLRPKMTPPIQVTGLVKRPASVVPAGGAPWWPGPSPPSSPNTPMPPPTTTPSTTTASSFMVDFGTEFQGGLMFHSDDGTAGHRVRLVTGEIMYPNATLEQHNTWGWDLTWTLTDGPQQLTQHQYQEFRFVWVTFLDGLPPKGWSLSGWGVQYPWVESDTAFTSSSSDLNAVWELCRYTVQAAALDTFTDSNTRERRPYEADGLIAGTARQLVQRDVMWVRHSTSVVMYEPTWPVEWKQMTPLLAQLDYMATGQPALAVAYQDQLFADTMFQHLEASTGVINTTWKGARHIIGWDPAQTRAMFRVNDHMSVCNAFAVCGLETLGELLDVAGQPANASALRAKSATLRAGMMKQMWNRTASRFCDGICTDPVVDGHSGPDTDFFTYWLGLVPSDAEANVWNWATKWGMEAVGDYGAWVYVNAIAQQPSNGGGDTGEAMLHALTKTDPTSWLFSLRTYNLTMTRETFNSAGYPATLSHLWGVAAIPGVVFGLAGLQQLSPTYETFVVKPRLGGLTYLNITVPTLRGAITIDATPTAVAVTVPCNCVATQLCLPRVGQSEQSGSAPVLVLDGVAVTHPVVDSSGLFDCVENVGCGGGSRPRVLSRRFM